LDIEPADILGGVIMVGRIVTGETEKLENAPPLS
jgi:hypothetical protein